MSTLKEAVATAWHNANEGGYEEEFKAMTFEDIAGDMIAYDDDISSFAENKTTEEGAAMGDYDILLKEIVKLLPDITGRSE